MTSGAESTRTQGHGLNPLARLASLCRRHRLPLSLLAIQIRNLGDLNKQLGEERLRRLQRQLAQAIQQRTRAEDALVTWQQGYLVLCLAGTDAPGAQGLAERLAEWFQGTRFNLDRFSLQLQTAMAVHVADHQADPDAESVRDLLMDTLCLLAADDGQGPALSKRARQRHTIAGQPINGERRAGAAPLPSGPEAADPVDTQQLKDLLDTLREDRHILLRTLSPALRSLDESTRLLLVDHLLEASVLPPPAGSH